VVDTSASQLIESERLQKRFLSEGLFAENGGDAVGSILSQAGKQG
jgi:hypothetical protein